MTTLLFANHLFARRLQSVYRFSLFQLAETKRSAWFAQPPFVVLQTIANDVSTRATPVPARSLSNYFLGQSLVDRNATPGIPTSGTNYRSTYTQTWNLNVQHQFAHNLALEVGYVANKGTRTQHSSQLPRQPQPGPLRLRRPAQFCHQLHLGATLR